MESVCFMSPVATALATAFLSVVLATAHADEGDLSRDAVTVEILEGIPAEDCWEFPRPEAADRFAEPAFAFVGLPKKYSDRGLIEDRTNPFLLRASGAVSLPAGEYRIVLRSRGAARLTLDGKLLVATDFLKRNEDGHEAVPELDQGESDDVHPLPPGHQQRSTTVRINQPTSRFILEAMIGGKGLRAEVGELVVAIAGENESLRVLSPAATIPFSDRVWLAFAEERRERLATFDSERRRNADAQEKAYWAMRHKLARERVASTHAPKPPQVSADMPVRNAIDRYVGARLNAAGARPAPLADDWTFLRRVTLDTVGVIPTRQEIAAFFDDDDLQRRERLIDRLLADPRWADHWVGYWQDVLAENPGVLKPKLNNTGPFRWWIYESFLDNKPIDRFATELILMEGSRYGGAPGGFAMSTQNDAPMAAKAHVIAKALLAVEMKCARCHDAPYHEVEQRDTFSLAAMLNKGPQKVPGSSVVPTGPGAREVAVTVSLKSGDEVAPRWPFEELALADVPAGILRDPDDTRERLAAIITSADNERFAPVMVNRLWKRYLGRGLVEPVDDWENAEPTAPQLLDYLAREFVTHDYDLKHVARLILTSHTYQRQAAYAAAGGAEVDPDLFASPARRRMTAEQIVDSAFAAAGKEFGAEEMNLDPEGRRSIESFLNLGVPSRGWHFTSLSNERDRPALALPVAQNIVDLLIAFGWRESRQDPITERDETPNVLQPAVLANGVAGRRIVRLSDDSAFTELALEDRTLEELVEAVFLQVLTRRPTATEKQMFVELLADGYADRITAPKASSATRRQDRRTAVSWSNHLSAEATIIKLELEKAVRAGDPPTERLRGQWRERIEDMVWALVNSPEFVFIP